jgi:membrane-associated protease RseP (regulator of RpoE activity)
MNASKFALPLMLLQCVAASAAAPRVASVADTLAENYRATGGGAWDTKAALELDYGYSGQGLTGTVRSLDDLRGGGFVDSASIGPLVVVSGFDGTHAWGQEPSGTVTDEAGGDTVPLAVNESYRNLNLWWRRDRGGARVDWHGIRSDSNTGSRDAVLLVTPRGGKPFEAWFDRRTHLLARTVEVQGSQTITTLFSEYHPVEGVRLAQKIVIDDGTGPANRQTQTLMSARFLSPQPASAFSMPHPILHDFFLEGGAHELSVPFELINNHIYAQVSVNGAAPHPWIFDTGGHDVVMPAESKALGLRPIGSQTVTGGGAGFAQSGFAKVHSISVGGATLTNQVVAVIPLESEDVEGIDGAGMIGYEFFARFVTQIDYGAHRIRFIDKRYFDPKSVGTPVPFVFFGQWPVVQGSYDGIPARFGIDTGARMALQLTRPFVEAHRLRAGTATGVEAVVGWGVGGPSRGFVEHGGMLKLGDVSVPRPLTVLASDARGAGGAGAFPNNAGGGVLKRFIVTLDYDRYTIYLKPIAQPIPDLDTFDESGLWINGAPQGFRIRSVVPRSPAQEAGLEAGDTIVAVNGTPCSEIKLYDLRRQLRNDPPGTVVTFTVRHNNDAPRSVRVRLRTLI